MKPIDLTEAEKFIEECEVYDDEHPEVWNMFEKMALQAIEDGRKTFGASFIIDYIRWYTDIPAPEDKKAAYYARKFMLEHDRFGFFETTQSLVDVWEPWLAYRLEKEPILW